MGEVDFRRQLLDQFGPEFLAQIETNGRRLEHQEMGDQSIVLGMHVSAGNDRQKDGTYRPVLGPSGYWWMPAWEVVLTLVPLSSSGGIGTSQVVGGHSGCNSAPLRRSPLPRPVAQRAAGSPRAGPCELLARRSRTKAGR